jgi:NAD+-dependent secondary alcohol dehydrogenase Adh1
MKALRLHAFKELPKVEDVPEPVVTGPFDVIVRIGGAGLCRTDVHFMQMDMGDRSHLLPMTLGHENAGWVQEVGPEVTNVSPGDAVACHPVVSCGLCRPCRDGDDSHCTKRRSTGLDHDGGFAELLKTHARAVVKLPDGVEPAEVAGHADGGLTAYHAAKKANTMGLLYPGSRTVVIGVGGLGHVAIQVLKAISATEVIAIDVAPEALELAKECGADHTVLADDKQVAKVLELTEGRGAQAVLDYVGDHGSPDAGFKMLARAGTHFVVGYGGTIQIPTAEVIRAEKSFVGNFVGRYNDLVELIALAKQGKAKMYSKMYDLEDGPQAFTDLIEGRIRGRGILVPRLM